MFPHFFPWFYLSDKNEWWRRHYSISSLFNIKLFSTSSSSLSDGWKKSSFRLLHRNASCRKIRFSILLLLSKQKSNKNQWFSAKMSLYCLTGLKNVLCELKIYTLQQLCQTITCYFILFSNLNLNFRAKTIFQLWLILRRANWILKVLFTKKAIRKKSRACISREKISKSELNTTFWIFPHFFQHW